VCARTAHLAPGRWSPASGVGVAPQGTGTPCSDANAPLVDGTGLAATPDASHPAGHPVGLGGRLASACCTAGGRRSFAPPLGAPRAGAVATCPGRPRGVSAAPPPAGAPSGRPASLPPGGPGRARPRLAAPSPGGPGPVAADPRRGPRWCPWALAPPGMEGRLARDRRGLQAPGPAHRHGVSGPAARGGTAAAHRPRDGSAPGPLAPGRRARPPLGLGECCGFASP